MNKTTDILKRFVELAPKEWLCLWRKSHPDEVALVAIPMSGFSDGRNVAIRLTDDRASAEAIVFLWEWLEAEGFPESRWYPSKVHDGKRFVDLHKSPASIATCVGVAGATRIELIVRACVAVLESKVTP